MTEKYKGEVKRFQPEFYQDNVEMGDMAVAGGIQSNRANDEEADIHQPVTSNVQHKVHGDYNYQVDTDYNNDSVSYKPTVKAQKVDYEYYDGQNTDSI